MVATWAYFDTSVLAKRYVEEAGSPRARSLFRKYRFLSSAIAPLELVSAITRRYKTGELTDKNHQAIMNRIHVDRSYWELVEVSPIVLERAEDLITNTNLRSLDAIHVASALVFQSLTGRRIPFITADEMQREAASSGMLDVVYV